MKGQGLKMIKKTKAKRGSMKGSGPKTMTGGADLREGHNKLSWPPLGKPMAKAKDHGR